MAYTPGVKWQKFSECAPPALGNLRLFVDGEFTSAYREGDGVYDWSGNLMIALGDSTADMSGCWWKEQGNG